MGADGFWNHQETAKPVIAELKVIKAQIEPGAGDPARDR
jgi:hypothetical protein